MMTTNSFLSKQIDQFSKLKSDEEKAAFWADFSANFDKLTEEEQTGTQQEWKTNVEHINNRLKEISTQLTSSQKTIEIFPKNEEETRLIETLLSKMNVKFSFK